MKLSCFRAKRHAVNFMAADASSVYLATGCGVDVRVWKGDKQCTFVPISLCFVDLRLCIHTLDDWKGHGFLGHPKKSADNCDAEVILTGLHWRSSCNDDDIRLITTYRHHGIQYVLIHGLLHKKF
jgi:hypothetical protein